MGRVNIAYREYADIVPRIFILVWQRRLILFHSPFNETAEDFEDYFNVYELPMKLAEIVAAMSWERLGETAGRYIGRVPVDPVAVAVAETRGQRIARLFRSPPIRPAPSKPPLWGFSDLSIDDSVLRSLSL